MVWECEGAPMPNPPPGWGVVAAARPPPRQQLRAADSQQPLLQQEAQQQQQPLQQDVRQQQSQEHTLWEVQQQEEYLAWQDEPEDYRAAASVQDQEPEHKAQQGAGSRRPPSESGDDNNDPVPAQRPLFFARFTAGWLYASMGTVAASILEKRRDYAAAVDLLRLLLGGNACLARRGAWWTRLSINLEHMKVSRFRELPTRILQGLD